MDEDRRCVGARHHGPEDQPVTGTPSWPRHAERRRPDHDDDPYEQGKQADALV
jgi:hypothetical protein